LVRVTNSSDRSTLPNLIVIGAQKCGTTSLHYYLDQHPEIAMSRPKELNFFSRDAWERGVAWYAAQFKPGAAIRGESSPSYTFYPRHRGVAERMYSIVPDAKLIYLVRDPIDRIVSHYLHDYVSGVEHRGIEEALADPNRDRFLAVSKYFMQLEQYLAFYPRSSVLVLTHDELLHDRTGTMRQVFDFLGVDSAFYDKRFESHRYRTSDRRRKTRLGASLATMMRGIELSDWLSFQVQWLLPYPFARRVERPAVSGALRESLTRELQDDVNRLRELTGKEFPSWSV
jgi:hypothetical protein